MNSNDFLNIYIKQNISSILGLLIITVWVAFFVFFILIVLKGFGVLRIDSDTEVAGIDKEKCNYEAISFTNEDHQQVNIIKTVSY